jgi:hypothetical protein
MVVVAVPQSRHLLREQRSSRRSMTMWPPNERLAELVFSASRRLLDGTDSGLPSERVIVEARGCGGELRAPCGQQAKGVLGMGQRAGSARRSWPDSCWQSESRLAPRGASSAGRSASPESSLGDHVTHQQAGDGIARQCSGPCWVGSCKLWTSPHGSSSPGTGNRLSFPLRPSSSRSSQTRSGEPT